jgi:hypothetical protein
MVSVGGMEFTTPRLSSRRRSLTFGFLRRPAFTSTHGHTKQRTHTEHRRRLLASHLRDDGWGADRPGRPSRRGSR